MAKTVNIAYDLIVWTWHNRDTGERLRAWGLLLAGRRRAAEGILGNPLSLQATNKLNDPLRNLWYWWKHL